MNRFIVADSTKCIGCRTCEVACAVSHQAQQDCASLSRSALTSRIRVIKDDTFTTAVTCHHCEGAPCASVCPNGAIFRRDGAVHVEQSRCIGCKSCAIACPFGAMQLVRVQEKVQALKCNLCQHRSQGPACVEACPTGALRCIDPAKVQRTRLLAYPSRQASSISSARIFTPASIFSGSGT
ncbi:4Fe-4S dicluster domain-containing protein [Superficieibacter sp.]|uniref:4Fe-4S dicluster domain-containing protein n=1 Tax=Superficieibacter sp. TaxID=2303322 RepID=UPI0028AC5030|nr:4Fe-4S dicluster domain-containing protein [Superficieibacter sp.]